MLNRRKFLNRSLAIPFLGWANLNCQTANTESEEKQLPIVVSTWENMPANDKAWSIISKGGRALDAVEEGVKVVEADVKNMTVGYGGRPDRDGFVTLDACIMDEKGNCGSVCFLQNIIHPISVARKVMEETPHVMLAGKGALQFALSQGFKSSDLLTETAIAEWNEWKETEQYKPIINIENHDTIGMLAIDQAGNISGACTTSGMAYKLHGRVGDSPIIGAGLFVDNEVGGAVATGMGEAVMKSLGSFLVVELMRNGKTPQQACEEAVKRIASKQENIKEFQVGYLAINKKGEVGAYSVQPEFNYTLHQSDIKKIVDSSSFL